MAPQLVSQSRPRIGVWLFPSAPAGALVEAIEAAEEAGLDEVWLADEGVAREPMTVLAAASQRTKRIRLGVGVTSPVVRHPAMIAATAATLDELSGGRAVLGLGVGGHLTLGPLGLNLSKPTKVLTDGIRIARAVLAGAETDGYSPPDHHFPRPRVPVWVGARGPKLTTIAADQADGLFLSGCTQEEHETIISRVRSRSQTPIAIYQSAQEQPRRSEDYRGQRSPRASNWDTISLVLDDARLRHQPAALGINLIDLNPSPERRGQPPVPAELVTRAATILSTQLFRR